MTGYGISPWRIITCRGLMQSDCVACSGNFMSESPQQSCLMCSLKRALVTSLHEPIRCCGSKRRHSKNSIANISWTNVISNRIVFKICSSPHYTIKDIGCFRHIWFKVNKITVGFKVWEKQSSSFIKDKVKSSIAEWKLFFSWRLKAAWDGVLRSDSGRPKRFHTAGPA